MNAHTALLLIDVQQGLLDAAYGQRNNPQAEQQMRALLEHWRHQKWPVFHVQHCSTEPHSPLRPDQPGVAFQPQTAPIDGEPVFQKNVNSAFIGTTLEATLREQNLDCLVVVGLTTDHCVSTSVRMAANRGFRVFLVGDATATFERVGPDGRHYAADTMHAVNLASLHGEFCTVVSTEGVLRSEIESGAK
ncbi:MAG: cysteine hydrolase family protein [Pseudomonadota bacterium]